MLTLTDNQRTTL